MTLPHLTVYHKGRFKFFLKIRGDFCSSRCTTGVIDTGGKWKKSSIINQHCWQRRQICYRYQQHMQNWWQTLLPVSLIPVAICCQCGWYWRQFCRWCRWHQWQICHLCRWYRWCTLTCEYLRDTLGLGGNRFMKKKLKQKSRDTVPLKKQYKN